MVNARRSSARSGRTPTSWPFRAQVRMWEDWVVVIPFVKVLQFEILTKLLWLWWNSDEIIMKFRVARSGRTPTSWPSRARVVGAVLDAWVRCTTITTIIIIISSSSSSIITSTIRYLVRMWVLDTIHQRRQPADRFGHRSRGKIFSAITLLRNRDPGIFSTITLSTKMTVAGAKYCTPEIDTSEINMDVQWHPGIFNGVFQRTFTFQLYLCHLSSGCL